MRSCDAHPYRVSNCQDCHALNSSVALRVIQGDLDEARRAFRFDELMEEIEGHLRGEVDAS